MGMRHFSLSVCDPPDDWVGMYSPACRHFLLYLSLAWWHSLNFHVSCSSWVSYFSVVLPVPWFTPSMSQEQHLSQCFKVLLPSLPLLVWHLASFFEFLTYHIHQAGPSPAHCQVLRLGCGELLLRRLVLAYSPISCSCCGVFFIFPATWVWFSVQFSNCPWSLLPICFVVATDGCSQRSVRAFWYCEADWCNHAPEARAADLLIGMCVNALLLVRDDSSKATTEPSVSQLNVFAYYCTCVLFLVRTLSL